MKHTVNSQVYTSKNSYIDDELEVDSNILVHYRYFSVKIVQVETRVVRTLVQMNLDDFYPGFYVITQVLIVQKVISI